VAKPTAALSPADIASPIRTVFRRQPNVSVVLANVSAIDAARNEVIAEGTASRSIT
jgi:NADH dehydrogenase FAD-containing subunit